MIKRLIPVALLILLLCGCTKEPAATTLPEKHPQPETTAPAVTTVPTAPGDIAVETPCGTLYLPDLWDEPITVEAELGEPMTLIFYGADTMLYAMTFSETPENAVAVVRTSEEDIYIGTELFNLEDADNMLLSMQETLNDLLMQLDLQPLPEHNAEPTGDDIQIESSWGVLHYPLKWEELLETEYLSEDLLVFRAVLPGHEPVELFTVHFDSTEGDIAASLTGSDGIRRPVSISISTLLFINEWSDEELNAVYAMQEDLNYLLEKLK